MAIADAERQATLEHELRAGLPPSDAPGLEVIGVELDAFRAGEISLERLIASVDGHGCDLEARIGRGDATLRVEWARALAQLEALDEELRRTAASARWLAHFPTFEPAWVPARSTAERSLQRLRAVWL